MPTTTITQTCEDMASAEIDRAVATLRAAFPRMNDHACFDLLRMAIDVAADTEITPDEIEAIDSCIADLDLDPPDDEPADVDFLTRAMAGRTE